ncbi:MAG: type IV toxin-antitoxin system AbiEi family antitoxin domain-containing protein [Solirubrobacterales bacterium]
MGIESGQTPPSHPAIAVDGTLGCGAKARSRPLDVEIADLAARQHGVVALPQLEALGLGPSGVRHRCAAGRLHRVHRGVFAVGHPHLSREGRWIAAVLACGPGTVLSHRAGGAHLGLLRWSGRPSVTVPGRPAGRAGIEIHRSLLPGDEKTVVEGVPVTTAARTIFDCAAQLSRHSLRKMIREAEVRGMHGSLSLLDLLGRHPRRRGAAALRAVLADQNLGAGAPEDELERRFAEFLVEQELAEPRFNFAVALSDRTVIADCAWPDRRLIVELDGHAVHSRLEQIDADKERDRDLMAAGWHVIRVTWRHLHAGRTKLARDLRHLLPTQSS